MRIALDATYSIGDELSGVGVYSSEILHGIAALQPAATFDFCYRPHRFLGALRRGIPPNAHRRFLFDSIIPFRADLFHGLNQRMPQRRMRRTVCTFHDLFVMTGEYSTPEFRARFRQQAIDAAARADLIVTVSAFTAGQVHSLLGVEKSRLRVIHHGVHAPISMPNDAAREDIVLCVGAIQRRKNSGRLVSAFERLPGNWRLVLAGGTGFGAAEILARIDASTARARIEVTGWISNERLAELYSRARIFAFPSLDEGFGMPVLDAMAWGVPVITSNCSAMPEVAGAAALLVDPLCTESIEEALGKLIAGPELRRELQNRGRMRVQDFSWRSAVEKTWAVYQELIRI